MNLCCISTTLTTTTTVKPPLPLKLASESTHRLKLAESLQSETLKTLEWPSVCTQLSAFTSTTMGLSAAQSARIPLGRSPHESNKLLAQTAAAVGLPQPLDFSGIEDVSEILDSSVAGKLASIREICAVKRTLKSARSLLEQLENLSNLDTDNTSQS